MIFYPPLVEPGFFMLIAPKSAPHLIVRQAQGTLERGYCWANALYPHFRLSLMDIVCFRVLTTNLRFFGQSVVAYVTSLNSTLPFRLLSRPKIIEKEHLEIRELLTRLD